VKSGRRTRYRVQTVTAPSENFARAYFAGQIAVFIARRALIFDSYPEILRRNFFVAIMTYAA
jgi:hypothetical protein